MHKPFLKSTSKTYCIFFLQLVVLIWKLFEDIQLGFRFDSWNVTELLINYEGGFVRRGLLGQVIYEVSSLFSISPYHIVIGVCLLSIILFTFFLGKAFAKKNIPLFLIPSILLVGTPILTGNWVRKDILIIVFFLLSLKTIFSEKKQSDYWATLILSLGILIHESLFFFTFPIFCAFSFFKQNEKNISLKEIIPLLIPLGVFIFLLFFSGNKGVSEAILNSWNIQDHSIENAITSLSWSLEFDIRIAFAQGKAFTDNGLIFPPLVWALLVIVLFYLLINVPIFQKENKNNIDFKKFITIVSLFQFISILPLFVLGCDYGRWLFYWTSTTIIIFLLTPIELILKVNNFIKIKESFFTENPFFKANKTTYFLLLLFIGIPGFIMNTENYLNSTFIYQTITKISSIFRVLI